MYTNKQHVEPEFEVIKNEGANSVFFENSDFVSMTGTSVASTYTILASTEW